MTLKDKKIFSKVKLIIPKKWRNNEELMEVLKEFVVHRSEKRRPLTTQGIKKIVEKLLPYSPQVIIESLNEAMANSWNMPYPDKLVYLDDNDVEDESISSLIRILEKKFKSSGTHIDGYSALEQPGRRFYEREVKRLLDRGAFHFTDKRKVSTVMFDFLERIATPVPRKINKNGRYIPSDLFGVYVNWMINTASWLSLDDVDPMAVFRVNSKVFRKFLSHEARFNNNVNPLTGDRVNG